MKRGLLFLHALLLGIPDIGHAFTMNIASNEPTELGRGPGSLFVPGYGEVVFESGFDGALVLDSAYASTGEIEVPPTVASASESPAAATEDAGYGTIASRVTASSTESCKTDGKPIVGVESAQGGGDSVPETASAALGLLGILLFLLRRWR